MQKANKAADITQTWREYMSGVDYKSMIGLYQTVNENFRFYDGDQWHGIQAPDMPKPVFNFIKPACRFMTIQIKDRKLALKYMTEGERPDVATILDQMSDYARRTWDRLRMEKKNLDGLTDAFNTGDYVLYHWWDDTIETGQPFAGDINSMVIDNVNYYPGNPNNADVQSQPYIILAMRRMVSEVKEEAKRNSLSSEQIKRIVPDNDTQYVAGEMGQRELDGGEKCNLLLRMWKKDNEVWFSKATQYVEVSKPQRAKLRLYPIALMNWQTRKNCCHGIAETTYLKSSQVYLNKQMAFTQLHILQSAYPKVLYSKQKFPDGWSNKVAAAVGVNGDNIENVAKYMNPPTLPSDVWVGFDKTLQTTMDLIGVNDAAMGNISNPNNKSAFIAVRDAAIVPLEQQQQRFYEMMRDVGLIFMDFWINHYPEGRTIPVEVESIGIDGQPAGKQTVNIPFDMTLYKDMVIDSRVEVGESHMWSELNVVQTLDNLLQQGILTPAQYFERMPEGYIPKKDELVKYATEQQAKQEQIAEAQMAAQQMGGAPAAPPMGGALPV